MVAATWRADIHNLNNATVLLANAPFRTWSVKWLLNNPGIVEADMYLFHPSATIAIFQPGAKEMRVYRNNVLVWGGRIWTARVSRKNKAVRIMAQGYGSNLYHRILHQGRTRLDMDAADIAWDLIDWTQTNDGTFGITDGHTDSGFIIDRWYCMADKNFVGDAVRELSEMDNSFDYWFTPTIGDASNKVFKTAVPRRGTDRTGTVTLDGTNVIEDDYEIDAESIVNRLWGEGTGECNPPSFEATANASITTYGELHGTADFDDLDSLPSVKAHTREAIRNLKSPTELPTLTIDENRYTWGAYDIGDLVTLSRATGFDAGSQPHRVVSFEANLVPDNRLAFYKVGLDAVVGP